MGKGEDICKNGAAAAEASSAHSPAVSISQRNAPASADNSGALAPPATVRALFDQGVEKLRRASIDSAAREAELLLCHVLGKDRAYIYAYGKTPVDPETCRLFSSLLAQRLCGKPLQYIVGTAEFMGLTFEVNADVLIPRQDTELLAETAIEEIARRAAQNESVRLDVLDLCTGSGALAIAIAKLTDCTNVTASDISAAALNVAKRNAVSASLLRPIRFFEGDLFAALPPKSKFDMIVSNPPYIASAVVETLETHVRDHEPRGALDGGADGLLFVEKILAEATFRLKPGGLLLLEIGYDQGARALALATARYAKARILKDLGGNERVLIAQLK